MIVGKQESLSKASTDKISEQEDMALNYFRLLHLRMQKTRFGIVVDTTKGSGDFRVCLAAL